MQPISTAFFKTFPCPNYYLQTTQPMAGLLVKKEQKEGKSSHADQWKIKPQLIIQYKYICDSENEHLLHVLKMSNDYTNVAIPPSKAVNEQVLWNCIVKPSF